MDVRTEYATRCTFPSPHQHRAVKCRLPADGPAFNGRQQWPIPGIMQATREYSIKIKFSQRTAGESDSSHFPIACVKLNS